MNIANIALKDKTYYTGTINKIIATRQRVYNALKEMPLTVMESHANFLFIKLDNAPKVYQSLKEKGILVRYFGKELKDFIRVSIGTDDEMDIFLRELRPLLTKSTVI